MPDLKISQLSAGGAAQASDEFPIARAGGNAKITGANIAAAATSVGTLTSLTVSGNASTTNGRFVVANASSAGSTDISLGALSGGAFLNTPTGQPGYLAFNGTAAYSWESNRHRWFNAGSVVATLDASGNLGLGVTPQAWSTRALEIIGGVGVSSVNGLDFTLNAYYNAGWLYRSTDNATRYEQVTGQHRWYTAPSGTAGTAITFTQAMTLDAAGGLSVGTTASAGTGNIAAAGDFRLSANSYSRVADLDAQGGFGGGYNLFIDVSTAKYDSTGTIAGYHYTSAGNINFFTGGSAAAGTNATLRWQINSSGHLLAGTDATYDIGASGATRPRDVFVGRNVNVDGGTFYVDSVNKRVGVGTNGPGFRFDVQDTNTMARILGASTGYAGLYVQQANGGNFYFGVDNSVGSFWGSGAAYARSIFSSGSYPIGIFTNSVERVRVKAEGQVRFVPLAAAPTTNVEDGDVYYDSGTNKLRVRAGGAWVDLH